MYLVSGWWGLTRKGRRSRQGVVWDGHGEHLVSFSTWQGPRAMTERQLGTGINTDTSSDLENPVQSDGERAISLPQDGSTGSSALCTVEMCWEAETSSV